MESRTSTRRLDIKTDWTQIKQSYTTPTTVKPVESSYKPRTFDSLNASKTKEKLLNYGKS